MPTTGAIISLATGVSENVAFSLGKKGVAAGAGMMVFSEIFSELFPDVFGLGGGADISRLIAEAVDELESFYQREQISAHQSEIKDFLIWCQQHQKNLAELTSPAHKEYITSILLPDLQRFSQPGSGSLVHALNDLSERYRMKDGVLDVLSLGVSLLLLGQRMQAQLFARLASYAEQEGDDAAFQLHAQTFRDLLGDYLVTVNGTGDGTFQGWATIVAQLVDDLRRTRLATVISPLQYEGTPRTPEPQPIQSD